MFGTSGIRGAVGEAVTADLALDVGRAVASEGAGRVVVGRDARESGAMLADAVSAGLRECGADVRRLGLAATPTVARHVGWLDADAGVSVTASHNPPPDNGLKLWNPSGQAYDGDQRAAVTRRLESESFDLRPWDDLGETSTVAGATDRHVDALCAAVGDGLDLSVVVDAGNGPGALTATALDRLGCAVRTLNAQPDGRFPGRPSEPTPANCAALCRFVADSDADLGVAHDGDADRMAAVAEDGAFVPGDVLLALFGRAAAGEGQRVAAPVNTSLAVDDALAAVGAEVARTRVGDVYVAEATTDPSVVFGGEPSGAWIWPSETRCPDGPLAAVRLAELVSRAGPLSALAGSVETYPIHRESVPVGDRAAVVDAVAERVRAEYGAASTLDGVRVETDDGWFLVRASGTEPVVRVTAEARSPARAADLRDAALDAVHEAAGG